MKSNLRSARRAMALAVATVFAVTGCATQSTGPGPAASSGSDECNTWLAAGVGAVVGGLLASGHNRVRGAAIGAGLASLACAAWNYHSERTKTAEQVEHEYRAAHNGRLPAEPTVVRYDVKVDPSARIKPGTQLNVVSNIEVVQGTSGGGQPSIEQEIVMTRPDGKEVRARKPANADGGYGAYRTSFALAMPEGVPQGAYPVTALLYVNGNKVATNNVLLQVVAVPAGTAVALR
ncbi:MAG: hypothetical protein AB1768_18650 [Pseudomonadota bacterium]